MKRRTFLKSALAVSASAAFADSTTPKQPNLVFVFADQWRAQALGYAGDPNVHTPNLDRLAGESINCVNMISGCPVCSPYRGTLLTGQYPINHGIFINDVPLASGSVTIAHALRDAGYTTGYIGKWHVDGHGRSAYIPPERRQGFEFWRVLECTHDYNKSYYFAEDDMKRLWDGYDAVAQTREAQRYIRERATTQQPFALFLSWGPPHDPYETAPEEYRKRYDPAQLQLRSNVPKEVEARTRRNAAGYYAHCSTLDACAGDLLQTLDECGIADDTIFIFTSDHGDMLGSQGETHKQRPWDESIRVPFLLRYPGAYGRGGRTCEAVIGSVDLMPTLLHLCGAKVPTTAQGRDRTKDLTRSGVDDDDAALLACYAPFGQWTRAMGGREFRGVRTPRHTYIRSLAGPWLLYDNQTDPYQLSNLCNIPSHEKLQQHLDALMQRKLVEAEDRFETADAYNAKWGYKVDANGTMPYAG